MRTTFFQLNAEWNAEPSAQAGVRPLGIHLDTSLPQRGRIMKVLGLGNILFVKDFDKMVRFYEGVMNLEPVARERGWRQYAIGDATFSLHAIPEHIANTIDIADPPIVRGDTPFKPVFHVADFPAAKQRLLASGAWLLDPSSASSHQRLDLLDPEGNVFQITG